MSRRWGLPVRYVQNVTWSEACDPRPIRKSSGVGPAILTMKVEERVPARWHAIPAISAPAVGAAVGFDVTATYPVSVTQRTTIPDGRLRVVAAHPLYDVATFEVWYRSWLGAARPLGEGTAARPAGLCFVVYEY
ncbi:MAG: hypothetical protein L6E13_09565 [Firmicutes bacterium]|nr:hypothetical protein [Bacillota bacterium]